MYNLQSAEYRGRKTDTFYHGITSLDVATITTVVVFRQPAAAVSSHVIPMYIMHINVYAYTADCMNNNLSDNEYSIKRSLALRLLRKIRLLLLK